MSYEELLRKPSQTAERLVGQLGFDALVMSENSARKISEFMDPEMRHRRAEIIELDGRDEFFPWQFNAYLAVSEFIHSPNTEGAQRRLDDIHIIFRASAASFMTMLEKAGLAKRVAQAILAATNDGVGTLAFGSSQLEQFQN